ncbi:hypothetical protein A7982_12240 [Minicystis rosea]|nr:hypothetical protein A7982_12240 [Minicystis rosea]
MSPLVMTRLTRSAHVGRRMHSGLNPPRTKAITRARPHRVCHDARPCRS